MNSKVSLLTIGLVLILTAAIGLSLSQRTSNSPKAVDLSTPTVYWGAYVAGNTYGVTNPPWNWTAVDKYQTNTRKNMSILHWGQRWYWSGQDGYSWIGDGHFQKFETAQFEKVRQHGMIPMIDWNSWAAGTVPGTTTKYGQPTPNFKLSDVYTGKYDTYIRQWATDAKKWGHPFFLRHNHEMNGTWYSYSEKTNGNTAGDYVKAWKHVHEIFMEPEINATNVTWVWCPNADYSGSIALEGLYPGDDYVDWTCFDVYNASFDKNSSWMGAYSLYKPTYDHLLKIAPNKPIMIGETGTSKDGGSKSSWIIDLLKVQLPVNFPKIKALVWFNWDNGETIIDWPIEGNHFDLQKGVAVDQASVDAFASGIGLGYYASNTFANLNQMPVGPIPTPVTVTQSPTPTAESTIVPEITLMPVSGSGDDSTSPVVKFTGPADGANLTRRSKVTLTASATDNYGVTKVQFYVDGTLICSGTSLNCVWSVGGKPGSSHDLVVRAYDLAGNVGRDQVSVQTSR